MKSWEKIFNVIFTLFTFPRTSNITGHSWIQKVQTKIKLLKYVSNKLLYFIGSKISSILGRILISEMLICEKNMYHKTWNMVGFYFKLIFLWKCFWWSKHNQFQSSKRDFWRGWIIIPNHKAIEIIIFTTWVIFLRSVRQTPD